MRGATLMASSLKKQITVHGSLPAFWLPDNKSAGVDISVTAATASKFKTYQTSWDSSTRRSPLR